LRGTYSFIPGRDVAPGETECGAPANTGDSPCVGDPTHRADALARFGLLM